MTNKYARSFSVHHRKPQSLGGGDDSANILKTTHNKHQAFHTLFDNWEVPRTVEELNRWIDPQWEVIARRK